jgi:hypothetical protein
MRLFPVSAIRNPPPANAATRAGALSAALVAAPPSPPNAAVPVPATVAMIPLADTRRMRLLPVSAIRNPPPGSAATPPGWLSCASWAPSPSPPKPADPLPATVAMTPAADTRRMRLLPVSAIRNPPPGSGETPRGWFSRTAGSVAGRPSPPKPPAAPTAGPAPATVAIAPPAPTRRMRWLEVSAIRKPPPSSGATSEGLVSSALVAGPPSPPKPPVPLPAAVSIRSPTAPSTTPVAHTPTSAVSASVASTRRTTMRWLAGADIDGDSRALRASGLSQT